MTKQIWVPKRNQRTVIVLDDSVPGFVQQEIPSPVLSALATPSTLLSAPSHSPSLSPRPHPLTPPLPSPTSPPPFARADMANFPVDPLPFLPGLVAVDRGPVDRLQRCHVMVGAPPLQNDEFAIIQVDWDILEGDKQEVLDEVCIILGHLNAAVSYQSVCPLGVGLISFSSAAVRDQIIAASPHPLDSMADATFSVIPHDEGLNMRSPVFAREVWMMMVLFPLDYQTDYYVNKVVSLFGGLVLWHNPRRNKVRVLVKVLIKEDRLVPYSVVMTRVAQFIGTASRSWSFPVFILNG